jgi:hypothetical protein
MGFILNASDSNGSGPRLSARIQVKTYPWSSILDIFVTLRRRWISDLNRYRQRRKAGKVNCIVDATNHLK